MPNVLKAQCAFGGNQSVALPGCSSTSSPSDGTYDVQRRYFIINTAIGATTGALVARIRGGSFWHGLLGGAFGGALVYVGKRTVTSRSNFAGLVGRELGAAGSSIVQNASLNKPMLGRFILPVGPTRLYINAADSNCVHLKVDLAAVIATIYAATRPGSRLDMSATWRAGAPIFMLPRPATGKVWQGYHLAGIVQVHYDPDILRNQPSLERQIVANTIEHELVHVAQYDFSFIAWSEAPESALMHRVMGSSSVARYIDLSLNVPAWLLLDAIVPNDKRPWEREAMALTR